MADLLARGCDVYCDFVTFPFGILGQLWYLNVFLILAVFLALLKWLMVTLSILFGLTTRAKKLFSLGPV